MNDHPLALLERSFDEDLPYVQARSLREHLDGCQECASRASDVRLADALIALPEPVLAVPPFAPRRRSGGSFTRLGLVAAAVLLAVLSVTVMNGGGPASLSSGPAVPSPSRPAATPVSSFFTTAPSSVRPDLCSQAVRGGITVCPATVAVGEPITITPTDCASASGPVMLYFGTRDLFGRPSDGTYGETELGTVESTGGRPYLTVPVPLKLGAIGGQGGGPVRPGLYAIYSSGSGCAAFINVK